MKHTDKRNIEDITALTPMQEGMLFHYLKDPGSPFYLEQLSLEITGPLDTESFEKAWNFVIRGNEVLRTLFQWEKVEHPVQVVLKEHRLQPRYYDLSSENPRQKKNRLEEIKTGDRKDAFDLRYVPFRVILCKIEENHREMIISNHHILYDGWSNGIILKEFFNAYNDFLRKRDPVLPVKTKFKEFVRWSRNRGKEEEERFWQDYLEGVDSLTELSIKRKAGEETKTGNTGFRFEKEVKDRIEDFIKVHKITPASLLYGAWGLLLQKYNNSDDIIFGTTVSGRGAKVRGIENTAGLFINTIPLRVQTHSPGKALDLLYRIDKAVQQREAYEHTSLIDIKKYLGIENSEELFDTIVVLENYPLDNRLVPESGNLSVKSYSMVEATHYDLMLGITLFDDVAVRFTYNRESMEESAVQRLAGHYKRMVEGILRDPGAKAVDIGIISAEARGRLLDEFNRTEAGYPENKTIAQLFEEQAEKGPDRIAVIGPAVSVSYRELNKKAGQTAYLLRSKGVQPGSAAGIIVERSVETVGGILGILKAGCAYLPIDADYPAERINFMLKDSNAAVVLNFEHLNFEFVSNSEFRASNLSSSELAYIIYTSGSTGKPKGVMVEQGAVINILWALHRRYPFMETDAYLLKTSFLFDVSVTELFGWFLGGGKCVILKKNGEKDPQAILESIERAFATHVNFVPSMFNALVDVLTDKDICRLSGLKYIFLAGEALWPELVRKFRRLGIPARLENLYGPTEGTVYAGGYSLRDWKDSDRIPIGKPLDNIRLYILDRHGNLQDIGIKGELYISGNGVARGYLNNPELTHEKFNRDLKDVRDYHEEKQREPQTSNYKTGDLCRRLPGGDIEFFGRSDRQVKVRGFRVELGEIEARLLAHTNISEAVVLASPAGEAKESELSAYITADRELSLEELREWSAKELSGYMIPSSFTRLERLPLTANNKIDYKALRRLKGMDLAAGVEYVPPANAVEILLVESWQKVLGKNKIGIRDNFFQLGGDSIKAIQVTAKMYRGGYKVSVGDIFKYPVISQLARVVRKPGRAADQSAVTGIVPLTPIQELFFREAGHQPGHFNQANMFFSREGFDEDALRAVFKKLQEHHDALRMTYVKEKGKTVQINRGLDFPLSLEVFDFRGSENAPEQMQLKADEIQSGIRLETGPLMKLGLFHLEDGDRLLTVIHHLVVDGVSWRILLEDLETLYRQYKNGQPLSLPQKTDSFKRWSEKLTEYGSGESLLKQAAYWQELEAQSVPVLAVDFNEADNLVKDVETLSFHLSEGETGSLLTGVNRAFGTEINDILLTAFGLAVKEVFGNSRVSIDLEGHGRQEILKHLDITRTVGWFTSLHPVILDFPNGKGYDWSRRIIEVKERLRRVPDKGIGYGILKYLTPPEYKEGIEFKLEPQIGFNYLGQWDAELEQMSFGPAKESCGAAVSPRQRRKHQLEVIGRIVDKGLEMSISYNKKQYKGERMQRLCNRFHILLGEVISYCLSREKRELTPGDLTYKDLSIDELEELKKQYAVEDIYGLTPLQEGMFFHALYDSSSPAYLEQTLFRFHNPLDIQLVEKSLNELVKRHDVLRTVFTQKIENKILQVVLKERTIGFFYEDISNNKDKEDDIRHYREKDRKRMFDLSRDVLMRAAVFRLEPSMYQFIWTFHHIVMDGWCTGILISEFMEIYYSYIEGRAYGLSPARQYGAYIHWLENRDSAGSMTYWQTYLAGYEEAVSIPGKTAYPGESQGSEYAVEEVRRVFSREETGALNRLAGENNVTLNTVIHGLWGLVLGKCNNRGDVVFGAVVSGRSPEVEGIETMVGLFINTVPVRTRYERGMSFNELLQVLRRQYLESETHHYCSLAEIQAASFLKQDLFDHILVFENYPNRTVQTWGLSMSNIEMHEQTNYNFNVIAVPGKQLTLTFQFNPHIFNREEVEKLSHRFNGVVNQVIDNHFIKIEALEITSKEERQRILLELNGTEAGYPQDKRIDDFFVEQAARTPDNIAVVETGTGTGSISVTYKELNKKSNRLAHLLKEKSITPGALVGIMMSRSMEMMVGIFALLKAGGVYLPIDSHYPEERIAFILEDSGAELLLIDNGDAKGIEETGKGLNIGDDDLYKECGEKDLEKLNTPGDPAYVIYTSGSTGAPKGVVVEHRALVNRLNWMQKAYPLGERDVILQKTTTVFDVSLWELFWWPFPGASLCLLEPGYEKIPGALTETVEKNNVTTMHFVPSMLNAFLEYLENAGDMNRLASLKRVFCSGEALEVRHVERFNHLVAGIHKTELINLYGPTEAAIDVSYFNCLPGEVPETVPIGKPIDNINLYVVDKDLNLQPPGIAGELYIAGTGLARGYLNKPELTAEKFAHDLWDYDEKKGTGRKKIYSTGDLARWQRDGNIEFLGRIDHQVKIRGIRIEPGEIENRLLGYDGIKEALVVVKDGYLCAYLVSHRGKELSIPQLKEFLQGKLPDYMVPVYFAVLDAIPLSPNGKISRRALPEPGEMDAGTGGDDGYAAPRNEVERKLAVAWQQVLGRDTIGVEDNFFMIGGDSIKAIWIASRMKNEGYKLGVKEIFENPTIARLSTRVRKQERFVRQSFVTGVVPLTPIQAKFFETFNIAPHHFNQAVMLYREDEIDEEAVNLVFTKIQMHHDALRMTFKTSRGQVVQSNHGLEYPLALQVFDLRNMNRNHALAALEEKAGEIQASIHLEKGPLMKLGLFRADDGDRLLIVIHHLVIDGVSWRILLEDIHTLYNRYRQNRRLELPLKSDSFKKWAEQLTEYAHSPLFLSETAYWAELESMSVPVIETDFPGHLNYRKDAETLSFHLSVEDTEGLLTKVNIPFATEINEILLTALGLAVKGSFGIESVLIELEGHGREEIIEGIDVKRTVGWFTAAFPVILDLSYEHKYDLARQIKEIKENLRRVPNKGVGYGILKYLTPGEHKKDMVHRLNPQIAFNYMGRFDEDMEQGVFTFEREHIGNLRAQEELSEYELDVLGIVMNDRLEISVTYSKEQFKQQTAEGFLNRFKGELLRIISFCSTREDRELTPSDLGYKAISIEQLDSIFD